MTEGASRPRVWSIAAHRGFADALVAGLVPRYAEPGFGLARLTLLLPSTRSARTMQEAFIRHYGAAGQHGLLMPRMAVVGDLDLDETLGALFDTLGSRQIRKRLITFFLKLDRVADFNNVARINLLWGHIRFKGFAARGTFRRASL